MIVINQDNASVSIAMNTGFDTAIGEWIIVNLKNNLFQLV